MTTPASTPVTTPPAGASPTMPPGSVPRIGPLTSELLRLRGHPRGEIRPAADRLTAAIWASRQTDRERRDAMAYVVERLLFDGGSV